MKCPLRPFVVLASLSAIVVASIASATSAAPKKKPTAYADPADAPASYALQGEYVGMVPVDNDEQKWGVQVIALGNDEYEAVGYPGGLPGDGWTGEDKVRSKGKAGDEGVRFGMEDDNAYGLLKDGSLVVYVGEGRLLAEFGKVHRESPTLGAEPPEGAVVLFDGTTPDNFQGGRMTEDGLLMEGVTSKAKFESFKLHMEFRTPYMPTARGQARGNSGFYAQGRYEVQILDSFGLEGKDNECGGIYEISDPKVNMCFPPLVWQTYDVDFTAAKYDDDGSKTADATITVRHNGVVVHEDLVLPRSTRAAPVKEGVESGPIYLQNHGNPVRFRNIWVVEK